MLPTANIYQNRIMLPYFPFAKGFDLKMGTSLLADEWRVAECDEHYLHEVSLKRKMLTEHPQWYFMANEGTEAAQWEALELILTGLAANYPHHFQLTKANHVWNWKNNLLNETHDFILSDASTLPLQPLDWVGRQVQEDLILLNADLRVAAGQLCFPSGWSLHEKMNQHFIKVHAPLPRITDNMIQSANKLLERIPAHKPVTRNNWGFRVCDWLDLSTRQTENYKRLLHKISADLRVEDVGEKIFVRIEHQTLSRLPISNYVLFTIHTYQNKLKNEMQDKERARALAAFVRAVPADLLEYKLMSPFINPLITYLNQVSLS
jgi:dimethylamine monooxygenase subunit A